MLLNRRRFLAAIAAAPVAQQLLASATPEVPPLVVTPRCYDLLVPLDPPVRPSFLESEAVQRAMLALAEDIDKHLLAFYDDLAQHHEGRQLIRHGDTWALSPPKV